MWYPKIILKKQGATGDPCTHEFPDSIKPQKKFRVIDNVPNVKRQFSPYTFQHFKATSTLEVLQNKDLAHHQDVKKFHANKSPMFKKKKKKSHAQLKKQKKQKKFHDPSLHAQQKIPC